MARAALRFAVVAAVALPIYIELWLTEALRGLSMTSECCPVIRTPIWLSITQTAISLAACTGMGFAIAILAHRDLRRRRSNRRRAIATILVGAVTAAIAVLLR